MKTTVNECEFVQAFDDYNSSNNFSVAGRRALFNWIDELDNDCGTETELDVIALCCEFTEYESFKELQGCYPDIESMDELQEHTTVIMIDDDSFIIQDY